MQAKLDFLINPIISPEYPPTRYQGSKYKLLDWIWSNIENIDFDNALDVFGGTGSVSYLFKSRGKEVTYNDILKSNYLTGLALIENKETRLAESDLEFLLRKHDHVSYNNIVESLFKEIYFTDDENKLIDIMVQNIPLLENKYKKALAYYLLFQSCIIKRPYNLFHRKNLYMRFADVKRGFGNKVTWDTSFETHLRKFFKLANNAVFDNYRNNQSINKDVFNLDNSYDLVYIDTPYINKKGVGVDYYWFYHFLEGLADYNNWEKRIDFTSKHRRLKPIKSVWTDKNKINESFDRLFDKFKRSKIVVSYRNDGIPDENTLRAILRNHKNAIELIHFGKYKYVLSTNHDSKEILLIGE